MSNPAFKDCITYEPWLLRIVIHLRIVLLSLINVSSNARHNKHRAMVGLGADLSRSAPRSAHRPSYPRQPDSCARAVSSVLKAPQSRRQRPARPVAEVVLSQKAAAFAPSAAHHLPLTSAAAQGERTIFRIRVSSGVDISALSSISAGRRPPLLFTAAACSRA